jgi:hypothetical protein
MIRINIIPKEITMADLLLQVCPGTGRKKAQNPAGSRVLCFCSETALRLNKTLQHAASIKRTGCMGRIRRGRVKSMA